MTSHESRKQSKDDDVEWLRWQADLYMAGDDKYAYRLLHIAERLAALSERGMRDDLTPQSVNVIEGATAMFAQCVSVLAGHDMTRHEIMVEESRPYLKALHAFLAPHRQGKA